MLCLYSTGNSTYNAAELGSEGVYVATLLYCSALTLIMISYTLLYVLDTHSLLWSTTVPVYLLDNTVFVYAVV